MTLTKTRSFGRCHNTLAPTKTRRFGQCHNTLAPTKTRRLQQKFFRHCIVMWGTMFSHDELSAQQHHPRDMQMPSRGRRVQHHPRDMQMPSRGRHVQHHPRNMQMPSRGRRVQHHPRDMQMPSRGRRVVRLPMWQSNKKIRREWGEVVVVVGGGGGGSHATLSPCGMHFAMCNYSYRVTPPPPHRVQICNATTATTKMKSPTATLMTHPYQCNQAIKQTKNKQTTSSTTRQTITGTLIKTTYTTNVHCL